MCFIYSKTGFMKMVIIGLFVLLAIWAGMKAWNSQELEKYIGKWEVPSTIKDQIPVAADGQLLAFDGLTMKEYTVVAYQLFLTNRLRQVIAMIADYFIFNNDGEITTQFRIFFGTRRQ